jgi:hypothetical protein
MRLIFVLGAGLTLAACQTKPLPPVAPISCPPSLTQALQEQPILPDGASIPRPVDQVDSDGLALTLDHMRKIAAWGRDGWARAGSAKAYCEGLK